MQKCTVGKFVKETRPAVYLQRNTEACSCNHCCGEKVVNIIYSGCVFVALGNQHVMRMVSVVICGLPGFTIFFTLSHKVTIFEKKKSFRT